MYKRQVDAIPHHQYGVPLPPHGSYILCLIRWENSGPEVVYPQLLRNGSSGTRAVPSQHHQIFYAQIPQSREDRPCLLPQRIGDADHGREYPVDGKIELGEFRGQGVELGPLLSRNYTLLILEDEDVYKRQEQAIELVKFG